MIPFNHGAHELLLAMLMALQVAPGPGLPGGRNLFEHALAARAPRGSPPPLAADWRAWMAAEEADIQRWAAQPRDDPAWVGGWPHDHVDAASGRFRPWSVDTPRPADTLNAGKVAAAWVAITREHNMGEILRAARLAHWLGRPELVRWAGAELDGYATLYGTQPVRGKKEKSVLFTESLQEAVVLPGLLEAIRLLTPLVPAAQSRHWRDALVAPMVANLMASQHEISNKSVWRTSAVALAGEQYREASWQAFARSGPWSFQQQMAAALSTDGYWFELSLQYQAYVLRALAGYVLGMRAMHANTRIDPAAQDALHSMYLGLLALRFANGEGPLVNDSAAGRTLPSAELAALMAVAWPQGPRPAPLAPGASAPKPGWDSWTQRFGPRAAPGAEWPPGALPAAASGASVLEGLRSQQWQQGPWRALMRSGQRARFHAHQDALSLELMVGSEWVWRNPGTQSYGSPMHGSYYRKAASHSAPLVGDSGARNWFAEASPPGSPDDPALAAEARFAAFQPGVSVTRSIGGTDTRFVDTLHFAGTDGRAQRVLDAGAVFHTPCVVTLPAAAASQQPVTAVTPVKEGLAYLNLRLWGMVEQPLGLQLRCGSSIVSALFAPSTPAQLWVGASPGGPSGGPTRTSLYLRMSGRADSQLRVVLSVDGDGR